MQATNRTALTLPGRSPLEAAAAAGGYTVEDLRPKRLSHLFLFVIVAFFVIFFAWASWATLEEVTRGEGRVIPSRQTQIVQNLEGGIVAEILVGEGEVVTLLGPTARDKQLGLHVDYDLFSPTRLVGESARARFGKACSRFCSSRKS